ncbi:hypothetical protein GALMADRAFT_143186 [Galerina marginata CBS 339.88]|uniref:Uncharacterized protein n=1 Tax=Galerina marginata (strain CBS 339.88) TaxID=685588 RepID=A0A067SN51_GALM3|nr:hypothetical protein GALMADRAFT_143186 [Galerina marginata CBS 339.88]
MKQYRFIAGRNYQPVSDGTSFVITTSMKAYSDCQKGISIHLSCGRELYWLFTFPPDHFSTFSKTTKQIKKVKLKTNGSQENVNFVVRVDKLAEGDNPAFTTYINGEYLATTECRPSTCNNIFIQPFGLPVTLTVFNDAEVGSIEDFVQEMRCSQEAYFDPNVDGSEGATRADGGSSSTAEKGLCPQDAELRGSVDMNCDSGEDAPATHDGLSSTPTGIHSPDADFTGDFNPNDDGSEGISHTHVHPPDANAMNPSSTLAWKKVVNNVLGLSKRMGSVFAQKERATQQRQRQVTGDGSSSGTGTILNSEGGNQPTGEL